MGVRYGFRRPGDGDDDDDAAHILELLVDDYFESADLEAAIERLLREGFETPDGERVEGLRELTERARRRRAELEAQAGVSPELERYRQRLAEIEAREDQAISELLERAERSGDARRAELTRALGDERTLQRQLMSDSFAERLGEMQDYEFVSSEAREDFEALMGELEREALSTYFEAAKDFLGRADPAELARLREMMDALSTMIEQDRRSETLDPSFESFMERFGDYFPGAQSLQDVVRQMAERAAAAEAMFNSLSGQQQSELRGLFDRLMSNMELNFSLARLGSNLRQAAPDLDWQASARLRGDSSFSEATARAEELAELGRLEQFLSRSGAARALPEVDVEALRRHLGEDAARHVRRLQRALSALEDDGFVDRSREGLRLSAKGVRQVGARALRDLFAQLRVSPVVGEHRDLTLERGGDREETARAHEPGEALSLHLARTVRNALARQGPVLPLRLAPEDFEVEEYESMRRSATVFAIDLSLSMAMRGNLVPAKKMVLALSELIRQRYPRDAVSLIGFGEMARELRVTDIPALTIDYQYGTNLQHALALARHLLDGERGQRQVIVVTDGEPTAHLDDAGEPIFHWPPVAETLQRTMAEVLRCTRAGITINVFALDIERTQFPFVEQIARVNAGRTFYTSVDDLGRYVLDDWMRHRHAV